MNSKVLIHKGKDDQKESTGPWLLLTGKWRSGAKHTLQISLITVSSQSKTCKSFGYTSFDTFNNLCLWVKNQFHFRKKYTAIWSTRLFGPNTIGWSKSFKLQQETTVKTYLLTTAMSKCTKETIKRIVVQLLSGLCIEALASLLDAYRKIFIG